MQSLCRDQLVFLYNCQTTKPCATDCAKQESRLFAYNINNNKNKTTKQKQKQPFYCDPKACPASLQLHFLKNQKCLNFHRSQLFTPLFLKLEQADTKCFGWSLCLKIEWVNAKK